MLRLLRTRFGLPWSGVFGALGRRSAQAVALDHDGVTCALSLVEKRTGRPHLVNGAPVTVFTRNPSATAAEVMAGRDPRVWEVRILPLHGAGALA